MNNIQPDRLPPHNEQAEKAVLGSAIRENQCIPDILSITNPNHFYFDHHQKIFRAIVELHDRNQPIDLVVLFEVLKTRQQVADIGGPAYLAELWDAAPTAANAEYYAGIVREKALTRAVIHTSTELIRDAYDEVIPSDELLAKAERNILGIAEGGSIAHQSTLNEGLQLSLDAIDAYNRKADDDEPEGVASGFFELDQLIGGFCPGEMVVIAARPSVGKTALLVNLMRGMKRPGLFVSLEQSLLEISDRFLFSEAKIGKKQARTAINEDLARRILEARNRLAELRVWIDDTPVQSMLRISATARRLRQRHKIEYVAVDYLQLIEAVNNRAMRYEQVTDNSNRIKRLARELKVPVIALAQLNRGSENRSEQRPKLTDLRESGAIEQDADKVILLHPGQELGVMELIVAKNRNGPTGDVRLTWRKEFTRFEDYAPI